MSDIPCIYEMSMVDEKDGLKEDILKGHAFDILLSLLSGSKAARELAREVKIPTVSIQFYLNRLINANLVAIRSTSIIDGKIEKVYSLASKDIEILNYLKSNSNGDERDIELSAQQFSSLTRQTIRSIKLYKDRPHKIKAYFIKANEDSMKEFKKDLEALFEKYQSLEDESATETYGFVSVLAPYGVE